MARTVPVEVRLADMPQMRRLLDAARKVTKGDLAGRNPTHLGGCIGMLSKPSCECGLSDLRFAVNALLHPTDEADPTTHSDESKP